MKIYILVISLSLSLFLLGCLAKPGGEAKTISLTEGIKSKEVSKSTIEPTIDPTIVVPTSPIPPTPIIIIVTPTPMALVPPTPTPTPMPTVVPVESTPVPTVVPTPVPPIISVPTPIPVAIPTPTPKYVSVTSTQVVGIPDLLDFTSGPTVSGTTLAFSATYFERGLGTPSVVQLWQRNGLSGAVTSDAKDDGCSTQGPIAFLRKPPERGMKYEDTEVKAYPWKYCLNTYTYSQSSDVHWLNAASWDYNIDGILETFTFSADITGAATRFDEAGKYVLIIFAGDKILSETVIP